jgi:hypothetical protein
MRVITCEKARSREEPTVYGCRCGRHFLNAPCSPNLAAGQAQRGTPIAVGTESAPLDKARQQPSVDPMRHISGSDPDFHLPPWPLW